MRQSTVNVEFSAHFGSACSLAIGQFDSKALAIAKGAVPQYCTMLYVPLTIFVVIIEFDHIPSQYYNHD